MSKLEKSKYKVMVSVCPTPHNKIWLSSGHVSPYNIIKEKKYLSFSFGGFR